MGPDDASAHDGFSPYTACWTEDVLAETVARLRDARPDLHSGALERLGDRLRDAWATSQIRDFAAARETFLGEDEGNLHLHSAAVHGNVGIIVSNDHTGLLRRAASGAADDLPYEVYTADDFFLLVHDQAPRVVRDCAREQARYHFSKRGEADLPLGLKAAGAPRFAEVVREVLQTIDPRNFTET